MINTRKFSIARQHAIAVGLVLVVTLGCFFSSVLGYKVVALILLMTVSVLAALFDIWPVLIAATLSSLLWNFFFIPPILTFHVALADDLLLFLLYFFIALINAVLTFKIREAENKARDKEEKENTIKLYNTLLNSLSHELRTPIATIIGAIDTLKDSKDRLSHHQQNELLTEIDKATMRLNRQVENLLHMSRLETGMLQLKRDWCDVNELINSVIQKMISSEYSQNILFNPAESLPLFKLDGGLIEQVLYNLIHNAIQYTPRNTTITIAAWQKDDSCGMSVSDSGSGFPEKEIPFVFDKFYRLPHTKTGGSGLGLSIVKGFIEAHKGTIMLTNSKNGGAIFTVEIPAEVSYLNNLKNE